MLGIVDGPRDIRPCFTGQIRDSERGLDYFNARYFGAALGRFTSADPMNAGADMSDPQTWNGYSYVRNSPLNAVDPSGMIRDVCDSGWDCGGWGDEPCFTFDVSCGGPGPVPPCLDCGPSGGSGAPAGGGGGGGSASGHGSAIPSGGNSAPFPPGSFPSGENLGLPPGMGVPGAWGFPDGCDFGPCTGGVGPYGIVQTLPGPAAQQIGSAFIGALSNILQAFGIAVFRGGPTLQVRPIDVKVGPDGLLRPGRGISLMSEPSGLERFGGAYRVDVDSIPPELEIVQVGRAGHYELVPRVPMTLERYQELPKQARLTPQ